MRTSHLISLQGSKFTGKLDMDKLEVRSSLFMRGGAEFAEVDLRGAKVGGQLDMTGSKFTGKLVMDQLEVGSSLLMGGGRGNDFDSIEFVLFGDRRNLGYLRQYTPLPGPNGDPYPWRVSTRFKRTASHKMAEGLETDASQHQDRSPARFTKVLARGFGTRWLHLYSLGRFRCRCLK